MASDLAVSTNGATLYVTFNSLTNADGVFVINTSTMQISSTLSPLGAYATDDTIRTFGGAPTPPTVQAIHVTTASLPAAVQGQYYSTTLAASGGLSPYSWQLTGGTLPAGLTLSSSGTLYGTPTTAGGPVNLTFTATDSDFPADTATVTLPLTVTAGSTAPPACGSSTAGPPGPPTSSDCVSGSNSKTGGSATVTSTGTYGSVAVTATGTGGVTVAQYGSEPSSGVTFNGVGNGFDVSLSEVNTFTLVTIRDCALDGARSLEWYTPAANNGAGGWVAVSPETYTPATGRSPACITITLSSTSSPPLADLNGTDFFGVEPAETVSVTVGGKTPDSLSGTVIGGAISIDQVGPLTTLSGTVQLLDTDGEPASVSYNQVCVLGVCLGKVTITDPTAGVVVTTPTFASVGTITTTKVTEKGMVISGPYTVSWSVTIS